jgi:Prealbumin-like fold domain
MFLPRLIGDSPAKHGVGTAWASVELSCRGPDAVGRRPPQHHPLDRLRSAGAVPGTSARHRPSRNYTFTNTLQTGAIKITKERKYAADGPGNHPHAGVTFSVDGTTVVTDANGEACVDGLAFGDYTVTETVPAGYVSDDAIKEVTVDNTADCGDDPYGGESVSFLNTPLTNVTGLRRFTGGRRHRVDHPVHPAWGSGWCGEHRT